MPFKSKKQARYFYWKAKKSPKWKKMAEEWSSHTDWNDLHSVAKHLSKRKGKKNG